MSDKKLYASDGSVVKTISSKMVDAPEYNPDDEAYRISETFMHPVELPADATVNLRLKESWLGVGKKNARMIDLKLPNPRATNAEVRTLLKAAMPRRAREADTFALGLDNTSSALSQNPEQEFLQTLGGPFSKQLYLSAMLDMFAKCFWELHHNPIASRAVHTYAEYVVGRGVSFQAKDVAMQEAWDEYVQRDNFFQRLWWAAHDLSWQGEIMWRLFRDRKGLITVRAIDPSTAWELIADPDDVENVAGIWQVYPGPYNIYSMMQDGKMVPYTSYTIRTIPMDELIHVKINEAYGEKRGRSDLYSGLSWAKRIRDYLTAKVTSAQYEDAFAWDVTVDGDQADVDAAMANPEIIKNPKPGTAWWHNKGIKPVPMSAMTGSRGGKNEIMSDLVRMFAAAVGVPAEYLGWPDAGGTKAGAITKTTPWVKRVEMRQLWIETQLLRPFVKRMRDAYVAQGLMAAGTRSDGEFSWPEPAPEDVDVRLKRLAFANQVRVISHKRFADMAAGELRITEYDYDKEQKDIRKESEDAAARGMVALDDKAANATLGRTGGATPGSSADASAQRQNDNNLKPDPGTP